VLRKIRALNSEGDEEKPLRWFQLIDAMLPGKVSKLMDYRTVPQTNTGGQVENTKALERTRMKELGKLAP
jgi:hypothetical protein